MTHISITDHGTMSGHREHQRACENNGLTPILGVEAYFSATDRFDKRSNAKRSDGTSAYNHVTLLAQNQAGIDSLYKIGEESWSSGYYNKPRSDRELLEQNSSGLIVLSGCLNGVIAKAIEREDLEDAENWTRWFKDVFGENFFMEVQSHNPANINHELLRIADKFNVAPVMASDCHYAKPEDLWAEEAMLILSTNPSVAKDIDRSKAKQMDLLERFDYLYPDRKMTFKDLQLYLRSLQEESAAFEKQGIDRKDIYENTNAIASMIGDYAYHTGLDVLPRPKYNPDERLEKLAFAGLKNKQLYTDVYVERLKHELDVMKQLNQSRYFLVLADMVSWATKQGIRLGPARGSAAGSLVTYVLGITNVDPIKYDLLFARFLDVERADAADVDVDIMDSRRNEVKEYLHRKFKHVASISTFTYFSEKGVIRDASRALGVPLGDVNKVLKLVDTYEDFLSSTDVEWFRKEYPDVQKLAEYLRGRIRSSGMHAAGIIVADKDISNYAPVETRKDTSSPDGARIPVVAYDMAEVEKIGLIKIDLLGLKTLSVIDDALVQIKERCGKDIDLLGLELNDAAIFRDLSLGHTQAVFQAEAAPYTSLLKRMGVDNFEELVASNALVRPGAMKVFGSDFIARKQGRQPVVSTGSVYDDITKNTYSFALYQEQIMRTCVELAGMSWGDANKVRRIIGKKKDMTEFEAYREKFVTGASNNVNREFAEKLWHDFEQAAAYLFNRCLPGDTVVRRSSTDIHTGTPDITVAELYEKWHSNSPVGQKYRGKKGVQIMALDSDGRARPKRVKGVYQNGVKRVYRVTLSNGAYVDATENHKHLTERGYVRVDEMQVGDVMTYSDFQYEKTKREPGVGKGWAKKSSRMLASDGRMRPSLGGYAAEYRKNVKLLTESCAFCGSSDGRLEVAHINSNDKDNRLENLARLCNSCHKKLDYQFGSRKKRHSKGYPVEKLSVVSIDFVGEKMTYDIEMDTEEHNFFANGVVTHNSHAVAYSMLTYWTAWLKHYYPLEFMYAALKNEKDTNKRTEYLIEAKRMKLRVMLPHVNKSDIHVSIYNNALLLGLSDIKYISDKLAQRLIDRRPYANYAELYELSQTPKSGITSRMIGSLNKIGGATFADNPLRGDEHDYLYEYLNIPKFTSDSITDEMSRQFNKIEDFDESGTFIFFCMVKSIKRGDGWSRVEVVDESGSVGVFHKEHTQIAAGVMYIMLVSNNRIVRYIDPADIDTLDKDPFLRYLRVDKINLPKEYKAIVAFSTRDTKAGKKMATIVMSNEDKRLSSATVFPRLYPRALGKLRAGSIAKVKLGTLEDGTQIVRQID